MMADSCVTWEPSSREETSKGVWPSPVAFIWIRDATRIFIDIICVCAIVFDVISCILTTSPLVQPSLTEHGFMTWRMLHEEKGKENWINETMSEVCIPLSFHLHTFVLEYDNRLLESTWNTQISCWNFQQSQSWARNSHDPKENIELYVIKAC